MYTKQKVVPKIHHSGGLIRSDIIESHREYLQLENLIVINKYCALLLKPLPYIQYIRNKYIQYICYEMTFALLKVSSFNKVRESLRVNNQLDSVRKQLLNFHM